MEQKKNEKSYEFLKETILWGQSTEGRMVGLVVLLDKSVQTSPQLFQ